MGVVLLYKMSETYEKQQKRYMLDLPPNLATVANEDIQGSPTKNVIILVVTVSGWRGRSKIYVASTNL